MYYRNQKTLLEDYDRLRKKVRALEKQNYELKNDARLVNEFRNT